MASQLPQSERKKIAEKFMRSFMKGGFDRKGGHRFDSARAQESQGAGPEGMEPERRRNFDDVPPSSVPDDMPPMPAPQE